LRLEALPDDPERFATPSLLPAATAAAGWSVVTVTRSKKTRVPKDVALLIAE